MFSREGVMEEAGIEGDTFPLFMPFLSLRKMLVTAKVSRYFNIFLQV